MPKILNQTKKNFLIFFSSLFFLFLLILAFLLSNLIVKTDSDTQEVYSPTFELYFLALSKSKLENESLTRSEDFQKIGAGGFVWKNEDYYYVVSSIYQNKNDAIKVQNSIKLNQNLDSEIFAVKFNSITLSGTFTNEEKKVLTKALQSSYDYYKEVFDIAISLDTNVYNEISARLAVNNAHSNFNCIYDDFNTLFSDSNIDIIKDLSNLLNQSIEISKKLCSGLQENSSQNYNSILKYRYTEILNLYYNFINN